MRSRAAATITQSVLATHKLTLVSRSWADISARVTSLAFSPSGSYLAASSLDESIRVYSLKSPSSILSLKNLCVRSSSTREEKLTVLGTAQPQGWSEQGMLGRRGETRLGGRRRNYQDA